MSGDAGVPQDAWSFTDKELSSMIFEPIIPHWWQVKPCFDFNFSCNYIWFAWWLITWSPHYGNQIDISISYLPD